MVVLLKTASVRVSFIQIMQVRVQNKGKSVWKSRYVGDVSLIKDYDMRLHYHPGKANVVADALSHKSHVNTLMIGDLPRELAKNL